MSERIAAEKLDGMSKRELVDAIQAVAPLDLLQSNALGGNPANVAKKASKVMFSYETHKCLCSLSCAKACSLVLCISRGRRRSSSSTTRCGTKTSSLPPKNAR